MRISRLSLNAELIRYIAATHTPSISTGKLASLRLPLLFDPGERWQYGINTQPGPNRRSAGSLNWGGLFNTIAGSIPQGVAAVIRTQIPPFADPRALALYGAFERAVYAALETD